MKRKGPYPRASRYRDRHGVPRWRYRKGNFEAQLGKDYGSDEFIRRYDEAETGKRSHGAGTNRTRPLSLSALIAQYYVSPQFLANKISTQTVHRNILEKLRVEHGNKRITDEHLKREHIIKILSEKAAFPHAANRLRTQISLLMQLAIDLGWRETNPILTIRKYKTPSGGFHTWEDAEIEQYYNTHEFGTLAHTVLTLLLYTAAARIDAVRLGRGNIKNGRIIYYRAKESERDGQRISVPILPPLQKVLDALPSDQFTFLQTRQGKSRSENGLGNLMRKWCDDACLPECTAHGLRKAQGRRLAEAGCTNKQIQAWLGHKTATQSDVYTKDADIERLSDDAADLLQSSLNREQKVGNHPNRFPKKPT